MKSTLEELPNRIAGLPSELPDDDEEAKRFDLLILRLQLAVIRADRGFDRLRAVVVETAAALEEQSNIPMIAQQLELIQEVQSDDFWQDVTAPMLERVRRRLRDLVKLIEKAKRRPIYTDFEDVMGDAKTVLLPGFDGTTNFEQFRRKAQHFLREHEDNPVVQKLRRNEALTSKDLVDLQQVLIAAGVGTDADIERATREASGFGLFVRSLVGMERDAAAAAFSAFLSDRSLTADQIEFVNMIVEHVTEHGFMLPARLYESPFTDVSPTGPDGVFGDGRVDALIDVLHEVQGRAVA